jgi:N-acetylmuramoyl-L-alanine amidase
MSICFAAFFTKIYESPKMILRRLQKSWLDGDSFQCCRAVHYRFGRLLMSLGLPLLAQAADYERELDTRYAPHANWAASIELDAFEPAAEGAETWWLGPEAIRENRKSSDPPLHGLHLALDPGHIGGEWAGVEGRDFKVDPGDFPVREGDLVLEVARLVRAELIALGAEVTLLRDGPTPLNPKSPAAYFSQAAARIERPKKFSWDAMVDYGVALRRRMNYLYAVAGELAARARLVNEAIKPDALLSLHINAAPWPRDPAGKVEYELVDSNHTHVLIFGCLSDAEISVPRQKAQLMVKMVNGSGPVERELGQALALSLGRETGLPPSNYSGKNAVRLEGQTPYLWARNLMLLRYVECPVVLLEPYIANSRQTYPRIQAALRQRESGATRAEDDILVEYSRAVVRGVLAAYGPGGAN